MAAGRPVEGVCSYAGWRLALTRTAYPALVGAGLAFGHWGATRGWMAWQIGVVAIVVATTSVVVLERVIPYRHAWTGTRADKRTDFWHLVVSNRAFDLGTLLALALCAPVGAWLRGVVGAPLWPSDWPLLLQALLATLLFELPWYWFHRLEHRSALLWRVHSVHHSSRRIYWWNFSRNHPIDNFVSATLAIAPLTLLGVGEAPLAVMAGFSAAHGLLQHSNIDLRTGVLDRFLATARVHRWHHSPHRHEADANYCPRLLLWDHLFGTYRFRPEVDPPADVGLGRDDYPEGFVAQMLIPFRTSFWRPDAADETPRAGDRPT